MQVNAGLLLSGTLYCEDSATSATSGTHSGSMCSKVKHSKRQCSEMQVDAGVPLSGTLYCANSATRGTQ